MRKIDYDKNMMKPNDVSEEPSNNTKFTCNKLKGILPKSGVRLCRIYMTKNNTKQDRSHFIVHMEAMNKDDSNTVSFSLTSASYHKRRQMIKAELNLDAINKVSS